MKEKLKNKKIYLILIIIILMLAIGSGIAFAWLTWNKEVIVSGNSGCFTINYTKGQEITGELSTGTSYSTGESTDIEFYLSNQCDIEALGTLYLTTNSSSTFDTTTNALRYTVVEYNSTSNTETQLSTGAVTGVANQVILQTYLNKTSTTYRVYLWIDESLDTSVDDESYSGYVHAEAVQAFDLAKATLTKLGLTANSGTPNFDSVATTNEGIYAAEDDLGISYYFRGAVNNNWVYFAGIYWRIIRINGDGSIRMIYSGTTAPTSSQAVVMTGSGTQVTTKAFNSVSNDNKYLGYTYNNNGTETDSTIKNYLENTWYEDTLLNTTYEQYLADAIYCNDREISTNSTVYSGWGSSYDVTSTTLGQGTTPTIYKSYERLGNYSALGGNSPSLKCNQASDRYTVSTSLGNGKLNYKVGLITIDEIAMAGGRNYNSSSVYNNTSFYLYTNSEYWTLTPCVFRFDGFASVCYYDYNLSYDAVPSSWLGVRPVVSLSSNVTISGNGTYSSPFTIS